MDRARLAATVGILSCLTYLIVLAIPFGAGSAEMYYASGWTNPLVGGLLALVAVVVFAAGRQGRTDGPLAAGVTLALGLIIGGIAILWAMSGRTDVLAIGRYHRLVVPAVGAVIPIAALWYARELDVL